VAHEYAHAVAAYRQGDDTAYMLGRITLNPLPHIDPVMSIVFPAITFLLSGGQFVFGGAKPVPVNPRKYRKYRKGDIIVSAAGVATNFVLSFVFALLFVLIGLLARTAPSLLTVFDGAQRMIYYLLPPAWGQKYRDIGRFGFLFIVGMLWFLPGVLSWLLTPAKVIFVVLWDLIAPFAVGDGIRIFG
jgi:hypothetical protein